MRSNFCILAVICVSFSFLGADDPDPIEPPEPNIQAPYEDYYRFQTSSGTGYRIEGTTKIWVGGDVMFNWAVRDSMKGEDPLLPFRSFTSLLSNMHFRMLNLETPILEKKPNPDKLKSYVFYGVKSDLQILKTMGIDSVFLGNNHTMDLGEEGLRETIRILSDSNLKWAGAGLTEEESYRPIVYQREGIEYRVFSFSDVGETRLFANHKSPGAAYFRVGVAERLVQKTRSNQTNILSLHWGVEYSPEPTEVQRRTAKYLVNEGYQVIVGHHPHVPQGIEVFPKGVAIYSLGNFLFGSKNSYLKHNISLVLHYQGAKLVCLEIIPIFGKHQLVPGEAYFSPLFGKEADDFLKEYAVQCKNLGTELIVSGGRAYVFLDKELKAKVKPY
ncbi:bacterial capsule synthesis protein [Leptospira ryugenii]|uniref:Bacterial capsule synthesis protein n=1 Tax=Leptospira ryugenii TaxID=1917863 RepID=A0A2P2DVR4_9LEPT|nr:CapA family protein [Leptospira ryugenii]GBF48732.1 bacterial capsule synthesis protein [Leptospira ryugenii]